MLYLEPMYQFTVTPAQQAEHQNPAYPNLAWKDLDYTLQQGGSKAHGCT